MRIFGTMKELVGRWIAGFIAIHPAAHSELTAKWSIHRRTGTDT